MVDKFQKAYEGLQIPYPADNVTKLVEAQEKEVQQDIAKFVKESEVRISDYQTQIATLKALLPFDQMTMEDFKDSFPEVRSTNVYVFCWMLLNAFPFYFSTFSKPWIPSTVRRSGHTPRRSRNLVHRTLSHTIKRRRRRGRLIVERTVTSTIGTGRRRSGIEIKQIAVR